MLFEHFSRSFNHKHNHWFTSFKNLYFLVDRRRPVVIEKYKHDLLLLMKIIEAGVEMMKWKTLVDRIISQVTDTTSSLICITALVSVKYETLWSAAAQSVTVSAAAAASATLISWGSHATAVSSHTRVSLPGSTVCPGQASQCWWSESWAGESRTGFWENCVELVSCSGHRNIGSCSRWFTKLFLSKIFYVEITYYCSLIYFQNMYFEGFGPNCLFKFKVSDSVG